MPVKDSNIYNISDPEEDKPLFSIPDEPIVPKKEDRSDEDLDTDSDDDLEEYELEEEEEDDDGQEGTDPAGPKRKPSAMRLMFRTLLSPVEGWKALKRARLSTDEVASGCFYPMIALSAVAQAAMFFYEANKDVSDWAVAGLVSFITFFFGYFTVLIAGGFILPKKSRAVIKTEIGKQFVMVGMATLAMFYTLVVLFPMLDPVLVFLPLWTIYSISRGVKYLRVPKDAETSTAGLLCMLIIGAPLLWNWIFTELLLPAQ